MKPIIIVGAGGFGREIYWLISEINQSNPSWNVIGFLDDNPNALLEYPEYGAVLGSIDAYNDLFTRDDKPYAVCTIESPARRQRVVEKLNLFSIAWTSLIHPLAAIGINTRIGLGSIICRNAMVSVNAVIGDHVQLNPYSSVGHDAIIRDYCTLSAHVDIAADVDCGDSVFIGSHGVVLPKVNVGRKAVIAAGSIAKKMVHEKEIIYGKQDESIYFPE